MSEIAFGEFGSFPVKPAKTGGMSVWEIEGSLDPFPAFCGLEGGGVGRELLDYELFEQHRILQPSAIVLIEKVTHHHTAGRLIGLDADIDSATVGRADRDVGEQPADIVRLA